MDRFGSFLFPNIPPDINETLFRDDKKYVIIGVIGKSSHPDCNKMSGFNILYTHPSLMDNKCEEGQITFYYNKNKKMIFLHFETTYDNYCMEKMVEDTMRRDDLNQFLSFNSYIRTRFARMLLFATTVCHLIVLVETGISFDVSYLSLFKSLKVIRERHVLKFLPKFVKNSTAGSFLGKEGRLCSPRFIFYFETFPEGIDPNSDTFSKLEFEVEDNIYKMLRNEFIITNNSSMSLFSIPGNKRFVYYNTEDNLHEDPLLLSINILQNIIDKSNNKEDSDDELDILRPFKGYGKPLRHYSNQDPELETNSKERSLMNLLKEHVNEALQNGFDDSMSKFKGKSHFVIPTIKSWFETFKLLHKIFIENPDNPNFEANDPDYKAYLENFHKIMDIDEEFFVKCCDTGLKKAITLYNNPMLTHYGSTFHKSLVEESVKLYMKYARGPHASINEKKLREKCEQIWKNGKQQCEYLSLRGNPCVMPKHNVKDLTEHSSGVVFVSACNCGRTQGRREDPYTIRQANYDFYQVLANNCTSCNDIEKINFPIFEPSVNDFQPAKVYTSIKEYFPSSDADDIVEKFSDNNESQPLTAASQDSHTNLSLESMNDLNKINYDSSDKESEVNEQVIKINENTKDKNASIVRQPSTTEYLPGLIHTESPLRLLPRFPSWSLVCVGPSSVYSHNAGLSEHFQSGFLSGANFLLPWDVHVELEHSASWAAANEKTRYRKKGQVLVLKIFIGCEYECPRGHRFIMSAPDKVLRGGSGIVRDSGSKVVFNDMPLYFSCPCRNSKMLVAQLMRIHIVTPKAPVNVILDPKIRTGPRNYVFTLGLSVPPKLSQSAYWILRLPYIYQGDQVDDGPIRPPIEITASNAMNYGCLLAGMYGVSETETETQ